MSRPACVRARLSQASRWLVPWLVGWLLGIGFGVGAAPTAWPPSAGLIVTSGTQGGIFVLDAANGGILRAFPTESAKRAPSGELFLSTDTHVSANARFLAVSQPKGGVRVWDLALDRLVWTHAEARATGFLGADGHRIAVLVRAPDTAVVEFSVWSLDDEQKVYSRTIPARLQAVPQPLASDRFAVFTVDQREIWVWDDALGLLRPVPLPDDVRVDSYEMRWPSTRDAFRTMVLAPDGRTLVFGSDRLRLRSMDLTAWTPPRRYDYPDTVLGQFYPLGVSANGRYLMVWNQAELLQFDLVAGSLAHKWPVYSDEITTFSRPKGLWGGRRDFKHIRAHLTSYPEVSPDGRLLAIWDYAQKTPVVFDITRSPPQEVSPARGSPPVCETGTRICGNGIEGGRSGHIRFLEPGGDLLVLARGGRVDADALWRFDRHGKKGQMLHWPTAAEQLAALPASIPTEPQAVQPTLVRKDNACGKRPAEDCRNGARQEEQVWPSWARPGGARSVIEAPRLCARLLEDDLTIVGVRHEVDGRFVGIRLVERAASGSGEPRLFAPGDVLFNGGWCPDSGCDDREFQRALWRTCSASRLVRDVRLEVGSADPARNRILVLSKRNPR